MKLRIYSRFNDRGKEKKKYNNETDKINFQRATPYRIKNRT